MVVQGVQGDQPCRPLKIRPEMKKKYIFYFYFYFIIIIIIIILFFLAILKPAQNAQNAQIENVYDTMGVDLYYFIFLSLLL